MNLSDKFLLYLQTNKITEFTTREARIWYDQNRKPGGKFYYQNLYYLVMKPLIDKGFIRKVFTGHYVVLPKEDALPPESTLVCTVVPGPILEPSQEDKEFFEYLQEKSKKGGSTDGS